MNHKPVRAFSTTHRPLMAISIAVSLLSAAAANAVPLESWDFFGKLGTEPSVPSTPGTGFQSSLITRGGHFPPEAVVPDAESANSFWSVSWPPAFPADPEDTYFAFSAKPRAGTVYSIDSVDFAVKADTSVVGSGPSSWALYANSEAAPGVFRLIDNWQNVPSGNPSHSSSAASSASWPVDFANLTSEITFHIFGYGNEGGPGGLTSLSINGDVRSLSPVPETLPAGFFGLIAAGLLAVRGKHRSEKSS